MPGRLRILNRTLRMIAALLGAAVATWPASAGTSATAVQLQQLEARFAEAIAADDGETGGTISRQLIEGYRLFGDHEGIKRVLVTLRDKAGGDLDDSQQAQFRQIIDLTEEHARRCGAADTALRVEQADARGVRLVHQLAAGQLGRRIDRLLGNESPADWQNNRRLLLRADHGVIDVDLGSGNIVGQWRGLAPQTAEIALTADRKTLVAASVAGCIQLVDTTRQVVTQALSGPFGGRLVDIDLSPGGRYLAASFRSGEIDQLTVWRFEGRHLVPLFAFDSQAAPHVVSLGISLAFGNDDDTLYFSYGKTAAVMDLRELRVVDGMTLPGDAGDLVCGVQRLGAGNGMAIESRGALYVVRTGETRRILEKEGQNQLCRGLTVSPDETRLLLGGGSGELGPQMEFDIRSGERVVDSPFAGHQYALRGWLGDGRTYAFNDLKRLFSNDRWTLFVAEGDEPAPQPIPLAFRIALSASEPMLFAGDGRTLLFPDGRMTWRLDLLVPEDFSQATHRRNWIRRDAFRDAGVEVWDATEPDWWIAASADGRLTLWRDDVFTDPAAESGPAPAWQWQLPAGPISALASAAGGQVLAAARGNLWVEDPTVDNDLHVWHRGRSEPILHRPDAHRGPVREISFDRRGTRMLTRSSDRLVLWDLASGQEIATGIAGDPFADATVAASLAPDGQQLARVAQKMANWQERIEIVAIGKVEPTVILESPRSTRRLAWSPDGRLLAALHDDGAITLWNTRTRHSVVLNAQLRASGPASDPQQLSRLPAYDWIAYTPDGYFAAPRQGSALLTAFIGEVATTLDQSALTQNRPDILLDRLELGSAELRQHYRRQHELRARKAGIADGQEPTPITLPRARLGEPLLAGTQVEIPLQLSADGAPLKAYNVFVNGVAAYAGLGKPIGGREVKQREKLRLVPGDNLVEVVAWDRNGTASLRAQQTIKVAGAIPRGRLHVVAFGVSAYRDPRLTLRYAHKDAEDLVATLARSTQFDAVRTFLRTDAGVGTPALAEAAAFLAEAREEDTVVAFVAGHGMYTAGADARYMYLTHDADTARLDQGNIDFAALEHLVADNRARRKLLLLDTCESGEKDDKDAPPQPLADRSGAPASSRGAKRLQTSGGASPRPFLQYRNRYLYNDVSARSGVIVFSSSQGSEYSYESERLQNGFFTHHLIAALQGEAGDRFTFAELRDHVWRKVSEESHGRQNPTVDRDNLRAGLVFERIPFAGEPLRLQERSAR